MTTYLVFGGYEDCFYLDGQVHCKIQIEGDTFQVFSSIEKAEEYKQDLLNGTNNSGLRGDNAKEAWMKYDHAEIRTFDLEAK